MENKLQFTANNRKEICDQLFRLVEQLSLEQTHLVLDTARELANLQRGKDSCSQSAVLQCLSKRELEVLVLVANGYNRKNIGETLGISINTAARHISNIYSKLGISTVAEATGVAYRSMLVGAGYSSHLAPQALR